MSDTPTPRRVPCPACGTDSPYTPQNRFRPFCSARCKGLDFGAWAAENFRVPAEASPDGLPFGDPKLQ